jgi:hypothetical protein
VDLVEQVEVAVDHGQLGTNVFIGSASDPEHDLTPLVAPPLA